jgi:hypothetical protein
VDRVAPVLAIGVALAMVCVRVIGNERNGKLAAERRRAARAAMLNRLGTCECWDPVTGMGVIAGEPDVGSVAVDRDALRGLDLHVGDRVAFDWTEPFAGANGYRRKAVAVRRLEP